MKTMGKLPARQKKAARRPASRCALLVFVTACLIAGACSQMLAATVTFSAVADNTTTIPNGTGDFTLFNPGITGFPPSPRISDGNIVFWGAGSGQQGLYALRFGTLVSIADLNTTIPSGTGEFVSFPPSPCISGGNIVFLGNGLNQQGVYVAWAPTPIYPPGPIKIADLETAIPGGTGNFVSFPPDPVISGQNLVFVGDGASGQQGVYAVFVSNPFFPPGPIKIADLSTAVPGGTGDFLAFGSSGKPEAVISGNTVAFIGTSAGGEGIYVQIPSSPLTPVADFNTAIPAGTGNFNLFLSLSLDSSNVAFTGGVETLVQFGDQTVVEINQEGVYTVAFPGTAIKIADLNTQVPGTTTTFIAFGNVAIDPVHVVFEAWSLQDSGLVHGLYTNLTGTLTKLVDTNDTIGGKQLSSFNFGTGGFSGNRAVFEAEFTDGSQGIGAATVGGNQCPATAGFWKKHASQWPTTSLILGDQSYSQTELLSLLNSSTTSDASLVLVRQLIAAKLNIANFSDPAPAASTMRNADGLLAAFAGKLSYNVKASSTAGQAMVNDSVVLENYNADLLTPGCTP